MPRSKQPIALERLKSLLRYDPETGHFVRVVAVGRHGRWPAGSLVAGEPMKAGHLRVWIDGQHYLAHRLAWFYMTGGWPKMDIDHRDCNPSNNRWANLREATKAQNGQNRHPRRDNKSGVTGVCWDRGRQKWRAEIKPEGLRPRRLGSFDAVEDAVRARRAAELKFFGEFAPNHTNATI